MISRVNFLTVRSMEFKEKELGTEVEKTRNYESSRSGGKTTKRSQKFGRGIRRHGRVKKPQDGIDNGERLITVGAGDGMTFLDGSRRRHPKFGT